MRMLAATIFGLGFAYLVARFVAAEVTQGFATASALFTNL
jgi:hypothetical protein